MNADNRAPWRPGYLLDRVIEDEQCMCHHQMTLMRMIARLRAKGMDARGLERIEAVISVTDDAIKHAMRKR